MLYAAIRSMGRKKEKTINLTELEPEEKLKYEIAEELEESVTIIQNLISECKIK